MPWQVIDLYHAVIVVDMAVKKNNKKLFIVVQSYMPAQDVQLLQNPGNKEFPPWYDTNFGKELYIPEWKFTDGDLRSYD